MTWAPDVIGFSQCSLSPRTLLPLRHSTRAVSFHIVGYRFYSQRLQGLGLDPLPVAGNSDPDRESR
jgi:hypothetical protein